MILRLAMVGFGNVGQEFARLLLRKRSWLLESKGLDIQVQGITTHSKGSILSNEAIDLVRVLQEMKAHGDLRHHGKESVDVTPFEMMDGCKADIMIELSPLNI